ncbi:cobalt ABC transporter ATP-binding protein [Oceanobacillus picturae]|uniref:Cobalt ABC transporter ATP-binding protein n=1 Tax=Oceanobacillus picturae TaxID=171693 RepID=A0A0U9H7R0_9BACI|nr:cobalt ABC transporter ATP-binding protein [Oceanobacillus picturae]
MKKPNKELRSLLDARKRKKPNDSSRWESWMLDELKNDEEREVKPIGKRRRGQKDNAKRLRSDFT